MSPSPKNPNITSPPSARHGPLIVKADVELIGLEHELGSLRKHPSALDPRAPRSITTPVGHDQDAVPLSTILRCVCEVRWSVEVRSSALLTMRRNLLTLAPFIRLPALGIEVNDGDINLLRQVCDLGEEHLRHVRPDGSGIIEGNEEFCLIPTLGARVNVWVTLVDALDGTRPRAPDERSNELPEDAPPVDDAGNRPADLLTKIRGNVTPTRRRLIGSPNCLLNDRLHLSFDLLTKILRNLIPRSVIIE
jgi:hypothetical protein